MLRESHQGFPTRRKRRTTNIKNVKKNVKVVKAKVKESIHTSTSKNINNLFLLEDLFPFRDLAQRFS